MRKLAQRDKGFVYLARSLPASRGTAVQKLDLPGIELTAAHRRVYPRQYLASQLLGSVGTDGNGLSGIEYADDKLLQGTNGERRLVKDALGDSLSTRDTKTPKAGARLELTIDAAIQDKVERVLADIGATYRPHGATAIVMNPSTGEVLAMANWPRINANARAPRPATPRRTARWATPTSRARPSSPSPWRGHCRTAPSRHRPRSTCLRRSRSPTASSASRIRAGR